MRVRLRRETRDDPAPAAPTSSSAAFSDARVPALLRATSDTILAVDPEGLILSVAPSAHPPRLADLRPGARLHDILPAGPARELRAGVSRAIELGEPQAVEFTLDPDGAVSHWSARIAPSVSREAVIVCRELTELREAEAMLTRASQLESLGAIAGVVAHDFNNLLTGILGNAELAQAQLAADAPTRALVAQIEIAARRAAELTAQLRTSGAAELPHETVDLNALIEELLALLDPGPLADIALTRDLAPDATAVSANPAQLRQVIMNLVMNAAEAVADGGAVTVRTRLIQSPSVTPPGDTVAVEVVDTGPGMDAATRARAFDRFFSTKSGERGLGLAGAREIVAAHGGTIGIESAPGAGTTFTVLLPATAAERRAAPAQDPAPGGSPKAPSCSSTMTSAFARSRRECSKRRASASNSRATSRRRSVASAAPASPSAACSST